MVTRLPRPVIFLVALLLLVLLGAACAKTEKAAAPAPSAPSPTPAAAATPAPAAAPAPVVAPSTGAGSPLPVRPSFARPAPPGPGAYMAGLEGYDASRPYANELQAKEKAAQLLLQYSGDKLPLWTKAAYGGTAHVFYSYNPQLIWPLGPATSGGPTVGGMGLRRDMGRCSMQGKTDLTVCDGRRGESYASVLVGDVFVRWEQPNPLTYVLRVRKGVLWPAIPPMARSDREVTAEDLVWYYETQKKEGLLGGVFELTDTWQAVDRYAVKVTMKAPMTDFLFNLASTGIFIIPKECHQKAACADKTILISPAPFIVTEAVPRQKVVLTKNEEYHIKGVPWVDRIVGLPITDPAAQKAAFITGQLDNISVGAPSEMENMLKQRPNSLVQAMSATSVAINFRPKFEGPLADVRVRRALTKAADWHQVWEAAAEGAMLMGTIVPYDYLGLTMPISLAEAGPNYQYNPEEAKKLLAQAGYPNGFDVTLQTYTSSGAVYEIDLALQSFWKKNLNVNAKIVVVDSASHFGSLTSKNWQGLWNFAVVALGGAASADSILLQFPSWSPQNFSGINDPVLDDLFQKQRSELNPIQRREFMWQFQNRNQEMLWIMPLGQLMSIHFIQPWELNATNHIYTYIGGVDGSTWTRMLDLRTMPKR